MELQSANTIITWAVLIGSVTVATLAAAVIDHYRICRMVARCRRR